MTGLWVTALERGQLYHQWPDCSMSMRRRSGHHLHRLLVLALVLLSPPFVLCRSAQYNTPQVQQKEDPSTKEAAAVGRLIEAIGDREMKAAFSTHIDALLADPRNSHAAVSMANLAVRALERQAFLYAANSSTTTTDAVESSGRRGGTSSGGGSFMAAATAARSLFDRAIALTDHFGAHYSLGLLLKLYPSLTTTQHHDDEEEDEDEEGYLPSGGGGVELLGYEHLCMSVASFARHLSHTYRQCREVEVVQAWNQGQGLPPLVSVRPIQWLPSGAGGGDSTGGYDTYLVHFTSTVYINGRDFVLHDLFKESPSPRACHIYLHSSGCYLPLFRQFNRQQRQVTQTFTRAASILQFSGSAYYHWLLESLPRLLLLRRELSRRGDDEGDIVLLIPSTTQPYVLETLSLLLDPAKPAPFSRVIMAGASPHEILAVKELFYVDWAATARRGETSGAAGSTQLWPPPQALALVRSTFILSFPPPEARDRVILATRAPHQGRSIINSHEVIRALQVECEAAGMQLEVFEGADAGVIGAMKLFPFASAVIGVHGAALANVVFSAPGTTLMEITLPEPEFQEYRHAATALGLEYRPLDGFVPEAAFESRLWIDPGRLAAGVREVLQRKRVAAAHQQCTSE